jgi:ABC-2 type transport system permease protein
VGSDFSRFVTLTTTLALTDFKLRFFGSALGYAWTLARPMLLFGVLYVVFTEVLGVGEHVQHYPIYLLSGVVVFSFFAEATTRGVTAMVERASVLRKVPFPRLAIPVAVVLNALLNFLLSLVAFFLFALANGVRPRRAWLELPALIAMIAVFAAAVAILLSAAFVRHRDLKPIWDVVLQMLFYASPVLYVVTDVPERYRSLELVNPLAVVLTQLRHVLVDPGAPSAAEYFGGWQLLVPVTVVLSSLLLGLWLFRRELPVVAESV